jgi:hypothetical protein
MLRDVFYYGNKPNVHPKEKVATSLEDARQQATSEHFWIINEFCDYRDFDWDFDFEFLSDADVWAEEHINVWPSQHQKDSGTWLVNTDNKTPLTIYRADVDPIKRKNEKNSNWVLKDSIDESKFDFSWHPDPTDPLYIYIFPTNWNPVGGPEYHVTGAIEKKFLTTQIGVTVPRKDKWNIPSNVDVAGFDFSWVPHPDDPPFIYEFRTQWQKTGGPQYVVEGADEIKYIDTLRATAITDMSHWTLPTNIDIDGFDFSWHPDATSPPYIYVFPTQWALSGGPMYTVEGATEIKYVEDMVAKAVPDKTNWEVPTFVDTESFDFSWHPYAQDEPYVYQFGTQWQKTGGPIYKTPGVHANSAIKYIDTRILKAKRLPSKKGFAILNNYQIKNFDYSWHPDTTEEPYIYVFGNNQYPAEIMPTIEYAVPGATQIKYVNEIVATLDEDKTNWDIPDNVDITGFDLSWKPNPKDPPFIYVFGTQWQRTGGPRYVVPDATELKFVDTQKVKALDTKTNWTLPTNIDIGGFDFSWHPDDTSPPYIYYFATQWALSGGPIYSVPEATEVKYVEDMVATALSDETNWEVPAFVDKESFDFSWHPYVEDEPYIYQFGTQWQKTGGPIYKTPGTHKNSAIKYIDTRILKSKRLSSKRGFATLNNYHIKDFDYSWHPDTTDEPYIYVFGNNLYPAEIMPTIEYAVPGATQIKYVNEIVATLDNDRTNWEVSDNIDVTNFDFSWKPNPKDPPLIYEFGTQWQKTGGPKYIVDGATEIKYVDTQKVNYLPSKKNWVSPPDIEHKMFDYSWHPDSTEQPYIYEFGTQWQKTGGPKYIVDGATEIKYVDVIKAIKKSNKLNWYIPKYVDEASFDFSWHPDSTDDSFNYEFTTVWQSEGGPIYQVEGATDTKYVTFPVAKTLPDKSKWSVPKNIDDDTFDFSWHPHPRDPAYIYEFSTQHQRSGGPIYKVDGAKEIKYVTEPKATAIVTTNNWEVPTNIDVAEFDFSWHPDNTEQPYIYVFGTQWALTGGPRYIAPGATEIKYIDTIIAKAAPNRKYWTIPDTIDASTFDFSWHPYAEDDPFIYQFGTQWQKTGGPIYTPPEADSTCFTKYIDTRIIKATRLPSLENWVIPNNIDKKSIDFSWHPDDTESPYIYHFETQWNDRGGPEYQVPGATEVKYSSSIIAKTKKSKQNWKSLITIDEDKFDYSWIPHPDDPPYIYVFGNQYHPAELEPTMQYIVEGATQIKYVNEIVATTLPELDKWETPLGFNKLTFDYSWRPNPTSPPYIYQFGTLLDKEDGPRYITPNNDGEVVYLERKEIIVLEIPVDGFPKYYVETTFEDLIKKHPNEIFWALNSNLDYSSFDFNWKPGIDQAQFVHAFGSSDSEATQTYLINSNMWEKGHREINWVKDVKLDDESLFKLFKKPDMFFVDRGNKETQARFDELKERFPTIQKTRYLNTWVDTINRCINRSSTNLCWILNSELDYNNFDFEYYPNPWQMKMVHVFGTQWSHWGTTFMVNRDTFANDTKYVKIIEHLNNINFVKDRTAVATNVLYDTVYIDHGNKPVPANTLVIEYDESYLKTFKKLLEQLPDKKEHFVWVTSSICDYNGFDFTYICDPFARDQLHVFPSDKQKFGDTFLINVNKLRELIDNVEELKDVKVNYNQHMRVKRLPAPTIITEGDTHVSTIHTDFNFPYATFQTIDNQEIKVIDIEPMNIWSNETKAIQITSVGGTRIVVPKETKDYVKRELYDYPYIQTNKTLAKSTPMDIVFLSNGETGADENYEHLLKTTQGLPNRVVRVDGVNGRVRAYHAAAEASNTPWMFTVFAKLKVSNKFDWNWQPDRLQIPKHYVFHAKNPVNGLVYGHQAMIAYNKKLTLGNEGKGLDFTMDDEHEIVEIISGTANFNTDEWSTWRTSFREALKLCANADEISKNRLEFWLTVGSGKFSDYSMEGAQHAVAYYKEVDGNFDKLKLSYDWAWLRQYYESLYK